MKWTAILPIVLLSTCNNVAPACDYQSDETVKFQGHIESVRYMDKKVYPYHDDTRKCIVEIESRIDGEWYPSSAQYIFGPDMSEDNACGLAENRAKVKVMREIIPETLTSERNLQCDLTTVKKSCKVVYMNVNMPVLGEQKVKLTTCEE